MSKARGLADLGNVYDDGALSNRSLIVNGAMTVAQRGTIATGVNASAYNTVDRFQYAEGSGGGSGALTVSQSTEAPAGFSNSFKFEVTTTDTLSGSENILIRHRLEGQDVQRLKFGSSAAESVTISFWVKSSLTGTFGLELMAGPSANRTALQAYTVSAANTWQYVSLTFAGSTDYSIPNDNARGFDVNWILDSGPDDILDPYAFKADSSFRAPTGQVNFMATSSATFQITGVQLEVGKVATPFEHRSYGEELALCQRYCVVYKATADSGDEITSYGNRGNFGIGFAHNTGNPVTWTTMPVPMRSLPAVTVSSANDFGFDRGWTSIATYSALALQGLRSTNQEVALIGTTSGLSNGQGGVLSADPDEANAKLIFDAEL